MSCKRPRSPRFRRTEFWHMTGKRRARGGHDLRAWFKTRAIEDGGDSELIRRITHAPPKDVESGYKRFSWAVYCREVEKLRVQIRTGEVLELGTGQGTAEKKARGRWRKLVTPPGLEPRKYRSSQGNLADRLQRLTPLARLSPPPRPPLHTWCTQARIPGSWGRGGIARA